MSSSGVTDYCSSKPNRICFLGGDAYSYSASQEFTARLGSSVDLLCRIDAPADREFFRWWREDTGYVPQKAVELDGGVLR